MTDEDHNKRLDGIEARLGHVEVNLDAHRKELLDIGQELGKWQAQVDRRFSDAERRLEVVNIGVKENVTRLGDIHAELNQSSAEMHADIKHISTTLGQLLALYSDTLKAHLNTAGRNNMVLASTFLVAVLGGIIAFVLRG